MKCIIVLTKIIFDNISLGDFSLNLQDLGQIYPISKKRINSIHSDDFFIKYKWVAKNTSMPLNEISENMTLISTIDNTYTLNKSNFTEDYPTLTQNIIHK